MNPSWLPTENHWQSPFNTPLECGLRLVLLLAEAYPNECDVQRLVQYDYLLVHSGDVEGGPPSIHPNNPNRAGEIHVRRPMVERGLAMMMSKSIIECHFSSHGITYVAGTWALAFIGSLSAPYTEALRNSATWVIKRFGQLPDADLSAFITERWKNWGPEFTDSTLSLLTSE